MSIFYYLSSPEPLGLILTIFGTFCWGICFYWMKRISDRQDKVMNELQMQAKRIEKLSKAEHDLIKEVHPQVNNIKESIESVAKVLDENILSITDKTE